MYAQCEENFTQIEKNYLEMLGRLTELKENDIFSIDYLKYYCHYSAVEMTFKRLCNPPP
jgi:hypothetical protein